MSRGWAEICRGQPSGGFEERVRDPAADRRGFVGPLRVGWWGHSTVPAAEVAGGAPNVDAEKGKKARRGQRATTDTAAGDYVACRRGTVSSYPRRPPFSDWLQLPGEETYLVSLPRSFSISPLLSSSLLSSPLSSALLLSAFEGLLLRLAFSNRVPPFFYTPLTQRACRSLELAVGILCSLLTRAVFLFSFRRRFVHLGSLSSAVPTVWLDSGAMAGLCFRFMSDRSLHHTHIFEGRVCFFSCSLINEVRSRRRMVPTVYPRVDR